LLENGQCKDRNGNGIIDTSTGFGDIRPWTNAGGADTNGGVSTAADECILHYTKVNSFGTRHLSVTKENDVWVSGTSGRRFDLVDGITGQIKRAEPSVGYGGYGGLIDKAGVIWSSNPMLRWDTSKPLTGPNGGNWTGYNHPSYGLCIDSSGNVWNSSFGNGEIRKFAPNGTLLGTFNQGDAFAQGCVVDRNDHVWVAHSLNRSTVGHLRNDGTYVGTVPVGSGPTGVAVDASGKIWATNYNSCTVSRINPNAGPLAADGVTHVGAVDFTTRDLGGNPYNYSDMTGSTLSGVPSTGTWTTIFDSGIVGAEWGRIGWTARVCGDASITVSVASSTNGTTFGPAQVVTNGADPTVANGRFLRINVSFKRSASGETPILYDLSIGTSGYTLPVFPNEAPTALAGSDQTVTLPDVAKLSATACDDGFPRGSSLALSWSKVSGPGDVGFTKPNSPFTDASFTVAGTYVLRFTASDSEQTVSDDVTITALPANAAPVVNAGPNQTITLPNTASLNGTVSDDGFPVGSTVSTFWSELSGPGQVTFNEIDNPVTKAIFSTPGTYVLRLSANDTHRIGTDDIQIIVNASPALTGATLQLAAAAVGPYVTGTLQSVRATLRNSAGTPLANFGVEFTVSGPNATTGSSVTNSSGIATFSYAATNPGTDTVTALVRSTATTNINGTPPVAMVWTLTPQSPPVTQGWIGGPLNGASVTGSVPITVGAGLTLTNAKVEYWPASNPAAVTTLVDNAQGGPGTTLATLDTTTIANGNYIIRVTATDSSGNEQVSQVMITVTGENKPGRLTFKLTDLTVPVSGLPITIARKYDSLERSQIGDFGYGWSLEMAGPRLEISPDNDVTLTEPGTGRRVTFQFTPTSFGFPFSFFYQPTYTPEPGVFGKLTSDGCGLLIKSGSSFACFLSLDPGYNPTAFAYTDPYGRVYTMTADGKLQSIKDLNNNLLTFGPNGITSSAGGLNVRFARDANGRITQITDPVGKVFRYNYDAEGNLATVEWPGNTTPITYTYDASHFFLSSTDARGNPEATTTYYPDGRLESITDAVGNTTHYDYNLAENKTLVTNPDGGIATIKYDANGLVLEQTDPLNHTTSYTYDGNRNKLTETNALQQITSYTYDTRGNMSSMTDPATKTIRWTYNQFGTPSSTTDQLGKVQTVQFDANSNPISVTDELGVRSSFTWDSSGNPLTETDGNGKTTRLTYDAFGRIVTRTDPLNRTISYTYDSMGRNETTTDAHGVTRFTYDDLGHLLSVTDPLNQVTRYEYDANRNQTAQIDAAGRRTVFVYDAANRLTKIIYPDLSEVSYTLNFRGQRLTEVDQEGHTTSYVYDKAGRLVKVTNPDLTEIVSTHDALGRITSITNERNNTTRYEYDPGCGCSQRLAKIIDPLNQATTFTFDALGRRTSLINANQHETRFEYDVRSRLIKTTFADNTTNIKTYDGAGHVLSDTDQAGKVTRSGYDEVGNLLSVTDAQSQSTIYTYDALNNLLSTTDGLGRTTRFEYDALNRLIRRTLPLGMSELYTYDQVGNRVTQADFRGKQTNYDFDSMNRLIKKTPDASLGDTAVTFSYKPSGDRASMIDASGTTLYVHDSRHRLTSKQTPEGTLTYTWDPASNLSSMRSSNASGVSIDYTYDVANRLASVVDNRLANGTTSYTYDGINVLSASAPNSVQSAYTYDALERITQLTHSKGVTLAGYTYTLDPTGRRLLATENNGRVTTYTYDAIYRLKSEAVAGDPAAGNGAVNYTYDPVGNRLARNSTLAAVLSTTSAYDANDRLTSDTYDANGNTRSANGISYAYDFENRIKTANSGAVRIVYDGDGQRVAKTVGGVTTKYLVDDLNPTGYSQVVEELVDGNVQHVYTHGKQLISQSQLINGSWQASFYGLDGHNNVTFLTDSNGVVTDRYTYDAFGVLISSSGVTPNNYLYNSQQFDTDLGFYFKRARYYNQDRGRFMTMDPYFGTIEEPQTLHKYLFGRADPVNRIDPCGMQDTMEYPLITWQIALRILAQAAALAWAISCVFYRVASILDPGMIPLIPPPWAMCAARMRRCRCTIRYAPPDIMAQCPPRVYGTGTNMHDCQNDAKFSAPQQCRQYYGHCGFMP
jgi:RHS repeat-associated protein